jgi:hypothetical protein
MCRPRKTNHTATYLASIVTTFRGLNDRLRCLGLKGKKPVMVVVDTHGPHEPLSHFDPLVWEPANDCSQYVHVAIRSALSSALSAIASNPAPDAQKRNTKRAKKK